MRVPIAACLAGVLLSLTGCISPTPLNNLDIEGEFRGVHRHLEEAAAQGGTARLLLVHGMGTHRPGWSDTLIEGLTDRLRLQDTGYRLDQEITDAERRALLALEGRSAAAPDASQFLYGSLRTRRYERTPPGGMPRRLEVWELCWTPTVAPVKRQFLAYDDTARYRNLRLMMNAELKRDLINERLSDPVLYLGRYREAIQFPVMWTLLGLFGADDPLRDRVGFISLSLGSTILFEALAEASSPEFVAKHPRVAEKQHFYRRRQPELYMLANQLPLFALAKLRPPGSPEPVPVVRETERSPAWPLHVIAFSDPNDILSYAVEPPLPHLATGMLEVTWSNVLLNVCTEGWFDLVAHPLRAHIDHERSEPVLRLIAFGHPASVLEPVEESFIEE